MNHVLEHIPNDKLAISELFRVLQNNGFAILQVPIDYDLEITFEDEKIISAEEREKAFGQSDHCRIYGKDYISRLNQFNWKVEESDFVKKFSAEEIYKFGLMPSELLYICKKLN